MKAVVIKNGTDKQYVTVTDIPASEALGPDQVLIRVLSVGLDGTDREIVQDRYGVLPEGAEQMIIGHELLGTIERAGEASGFSPGQLVTALVRRPCGDPACLPCGSGQQDFCETARYTERGIRAADGFLCEYVVEQASYVVPLPDDCASYGVLVEPQSIVEKVWNQVALIQQRVRWEPRTALITGSGPLGILTALTCRSLGMETHVWSRSGSDSVNAEFIRRCGAHYHEAGESDRPHLDAAGGEAKLFASGMDEFVTGRGIRPDMIWECSGHTPLTFEAMKLLAPNGVLAVLGVTSGRGRMDIPCDVLNQEIVLKNKCIIGSVNASRHDFETGIRRLQTIEASFPGLLTGLLTQKLGIEQVPDLDFSKITVKAVVHMTPPAS